MKEDKDLHQYKKMKFRPTKIATANMAVAILHVYKNMKLVTNKFKSGGLLEKHVVATWNLGNHLSISF
jgi:hypothetical protein